MSLVSVIIPTFNRPKLLREALESIARQTYPSFEIIVVDDGSKTPGVGDVCRSFPQCRYFRQENAGRSAARNFGVKHARGDFLAFVDDDDLWKPDKLARQTAFLTQNPEAGVVHGPAEVIGEDALPTGVVIGANNPEWREGKVFAHAVRRCVVKSPTPLMRRSLRARVGPFNTNLHHGEDWEFWARAAYVTNFGYIKEPLAYYRVHPGSSTEQTTSQEAELMDTAKFMAGTLARFVQPADRGIVRQQCCLAYLAFAAASRPAGGKRGAWPWAQALRLWPPCLLRKEFWALVKKRPVPDRGAGPGLN